MKPGFPPSIDFSVITASITAAAISLAMFTQSMLEPLNMPTIGFEGQLLTIQKECLNQRIQLQEVIQQADNMERRIKEVGPDDLRRIREALSIKRANEQSRYNRRLATDPRWGEPQ